MWETQMFKTILTIGLRIVELPLSPMLIDFRNSIAFWKVPRLRTFVLSVRATRLQRWVWSTDGMILIGENRSTRRKACPSATSSITYRTWTDLRSKPGLRSEMPATNQLSHGKVL
jgi:hypothetical protein